VKLEALGRTDRGLRRHHNEDAFLIREDLGFAVVADGMGGHAAGEVAARLAVNEVQKFIAATSDTLDDTWPEGWDASVSLNINRLARSIEAAHRGVTHAVNEAPELKGMGATIVAMLLDFEQGCLTVAHVGDSRAYIFGGGELRLVTSDHSWVHEQVIAGLLSEDAARSHPLKNVVTRALGGVHDPGVDTAEEELHPDDLILLCSDGLNTMLPDEEIRAILARGMGLSDTARELIDEANRRGGIDNITVVLAHALE
jgi:serine/threonine protein phosphatase PrpC